MKAITLSPVVSFVRTHPTNSAVTVLCIAALLAPFNMLAWCAAVAIMIVCCAAANLPQQGHGSLYNERKSEDVLWALRIILIAACYIGVNFLNGMPLLFPGK